MFKKSLQRKLENIFDVAKVTFDDPSLSFEQDIIFIGIDQVSSKASGGKEGAEVARVSGSLTVFSQDDRLPYGYFMKRLDRADVKVKEGLFFHDEMDIQDSPARLQNIHERVISFLYLYDSQYDPNRGELTNVKFKLTGATHG